MVHRSHGVGRLVAGLVLLTAGSASGAGLVRSPSALGLQLGPDTTVISAPLDSQGFPDYVAALNERLSAGVSREENFWGLMWPAIGNAERSKDSYLREVERRLGVTISREPRLQDLLTMAGLQYHTAEGDRMLKEWEAALSRPWTRAEFPAIARWVDAHQAVLEEVHAACLRPKAYAPVINTADDSLPMISVLLPHVQATRQVARLLASRAMLRLGEGDVEGAWQDLLDMYRLAGHVEQGWTLIEALVGYAIRAVALQPTAHWAAWSGLDAEELAERWSTLEPLLAPPSLSRAMDSERFLYLDTVLGLMAGRASPRDTIALIEPTGAPREDAEASVAMNQLRKMQQLLFQLILLGGDVNETLRYGNRFYDETAAALRPATHPERQILLQAIEARVREDARLTRDPGILVTTYLFGSQDELRRMPARTLTGLLLPAVTQVERAHTRAQTYAPLLQAAFLTQAYLLQAGAPPASLTELSGTGTNPLVDPFTGEPLRMRIDDRGLAIYSVGVNGTDDGGRTFGEGEGVDDLRVIVPLPE